MGEQFSLEELVEGPSNKNSNSESVRKAILDGKTFTDLFYMGETNIKEFINISSSIIIENYLETLKDFQIPKNAAADKFMEDLSNFLYPAYRQNISGFVNKNKDMMNTLFSSDSINEVIPFFIRYALEHANVPDSYYFVSKKINPINFINSLASKDIVYSLKDAPAIVRKQIFYFMFTNRIKTSVEGAFDYFIDKSDSRKKTADLELIRKIISSTEMRKTFLEKSPFSLDLSYTEESGKFAPRKRLSVFFILEFYSNYFNKKWFYPDGEIKFWESPRVPVWVLEKSSPKMFFDLLDEHKEFYFITARNAVKNGKIQTAVRTIFNGKYGDANETYFKERVQLSKYDMGKLFLLKYITNNDSSIFPIDDGMKKKEIIKYHLELLEQIVNEVNFTSKERKVLDVIYGDEFEAKNLDISEGELEKIKERVKGKIMVAAISKYMQSFESGIERRAIFEEEKQNIKLKKPFNVDRFFRLRLASRLIINAEDKGMDIKSFYDNIHYFQGRKKDMYISGRSARIFDNSKQKMFEFAFGKDFYTKSFE